MAIGLKDKLRPRFLRFAASSLISTAVDQGLAFVLFHCLDGALFGADYLRIFIATLVARACSVTVNYVINQKRVFAEGAGRSSVVPAAALSAEDADEAAGIDFDDIIEGPDDAVRNRAVEVRPMRESLPRFLLLAVAMLLLSSVGVFAAHVALGVNESVAKLAVDFLLFFVNYYAQRAWVFARRERRGDRRLARLRMRISKARTRRRVRKGRGARARLRGRR